MTRPARYACTAVPGDVAEWLRSGLQSRLHRFDSGRRLGTRTEPRADLVGELGRVPVAVDDDDPEAEGPRLAREVVGGQRVALEQPLQRRRRVGRATPELLG